MILTNPYTTLEGVDKLTGQPVVNITADDAPLITGTDEKFGASLVFDTAKDLRIFGQRLIALARGIDSEEKRKNG